MLAPPIWQAAQLALKILLPLVVSAAKAGQIIVKLNNRAMTKSRFNKISLNRFSSQPTFSNRTTPVIGYFV
jgi:hypothetical protein